MANLEHDISISPNTVFNVASASTQFTAMSVLLLARQGKLQLDDDVRKYLPELPVYQATITIRISKSYWGRSKIKIRTSCCLIDFPSRRIGLKTHFLAASSAAERSAG